MIHLSWMLLERHGLGELDPDEVRVVESHLAECSVCQGRMARIRADTRPMPAMRPSPRPGWGMWAPMVALAALVLLSLRGPVDPPTRSKGADVAIRLVRERSGHTSDDPSTFRAGDRFRVVVTCDGEVEVTVEQGGATTSMGTVPCGEGRAFRVDGDEPVRVCAAGRPAEDPPGSAGRCAELQPD